MNKNVLFGVCLLIMAAGCRNNHDDRIIPMPYLLHSIDVSPDSVQSRCPQLSDYTDSIPLDLYKSISGWVEPYRRFYDAHILVPFDELKDENNSYKKALRLHGTPVYEYADTIVRGINIKTGIVDYDLYPLVYQRDTVIVQRCWWFKSHVRHEMLYMVFERQRRKMIPIYGYLHEVSGVN